MRTAEEILKPYKELNAQIQGVDFSVIIFNDAAKAINEARIEAIKECIEIVRDNSILGENNFIQPKLNKLIDQVK